MSIPFQLAMVSKMLMEWSTSRSNRSLMKYWILHFSKHAIPWNSSKLYMSKSKSTLKIICQKLNLLTSFDVDPKSSQYTSSIFGNCPLTAQKYHKLHFYFLFWICFFKISYKVWIMLRKSKILQEFWATIQSVSIVIPNLIILAQKLWKVIEK